MDESLRTRIRAWIVASLLDGDGRGLQDDTDLLESGVLDSFGILELVAFLEETFGVSLDPADLPADTFRTLGQIAEAVRRAAGTEAS